MDDFEDKKGGNIILSSSLLGVSVVASVMFHLRLVTFRRKSVGNPANVEVDSFPTAKF